jgi:putative transposase
LAKVGHTAEQIIGRLPEAEVPLAQGGNIGQVYRTIGLTQQTYYRWRKRYGGLKVNQTKRLKEPAQKNSRLRKPASDSTVNKPILQEAARRKL